MELTAYADRLDAESQTQFSAITVKLEEDHYCVAYRGTDNTLIGWKEDFNMGFVCPVPGQKLAVDYRKKAARRLPSAGLPSAATPRAAILLFTPRLFAGMRSRTA